MSLFHSDEAFMCMYAQDKFILNKIYKKACNDFFKMVVNKFHGHWPSNREVTQGGGGGGRNPKALPVSESPAYKRLS